MNWGLSLFTLLLALWVFVIQGEETASPPAAAEAVKDSTEESAKSAPLPHLDEDYVHPDDHDDHDDDEHDRIYQEHLEKLKKNNPRNIKWLDTGQYNHTPTFDENGMEYFDVNIGEEEPIKVPKDDLCAACQMAVDFSFLHIENKTKRGRGELGIATDEDDLEVICNHEEYFGSFKEEFQKGCMILMDNFNFNSKLHDNLEGEMGAFALDGLNSKRAFCVNINVCDIEHFDHRFARRRNDCESCKTVIDEVEFHLNLEKKISKWGIETRIEQLCGMLPMRYETSGDLAEICEEFYDQKFIISKAIYRLRNKREKLIPVICDGLLDISGCTSEKAEKTAKTEL